MTYQEKKLIANWMGYTFIPKNPKGPLTEDLFRTPGGQYVSVNKWNPTENVETFVDLVKYVEKHQELEDYLYSNHKEYAEIIDQKGLMYCGLCCAQWILSHHEEVLEAIVKLNYNKLMEK